MQVPTAELQQKVVKFGERLESEDEHDDKKRKLSRLSMSYKNNQ